MSARVGHAWRGGGALHLNTERKRSSPWGIYLPDCPAGRARVAILFESRDVPGTLVLANTKFGDIHPDGVRVRLFERTVEARPALTTDPVSGTGARWVAEMPPRNSNED